MVVRRSLAVLTSLAIARSAAAAPLQERAPSADSVAGPETWGAPQLIPFALLGLALVFFALKSRRFLRWRSASRRQSGSLVRFVRVIAYGALAYVVGVWMASTYGSWASVPWVTALGVVLVLPLALLVAFDGLRNAARYRSLARRVPDAPRRSVQDLLNEASATKRRHGRIREAGWFAVTAQAVCKTPVVHPVSQRPCVYYAAGRLRRRQRASTSVQLDASGQIQEAAVSRREYRATIADGVRLRDGLAELEVDLRNVHSTCSQVLENNPATIVGYLFIDDGERPLVRSSRSRRRPLIIGDAGVAEITQHLRSGAKVFLGVGGCALLIAVYAGLLLWSA